MCDVLGHMGYEVTLTAPTKNLLLRNRMRRVIESYGIVGNFALRSAWVPPGGSLLYRIQIKVQLAQLKPDLVYGRHLDGCAVASERGFPVIFEAHMPVAARQPRDQSAFAAMISRPSFKQLVVISDALKEHFEDKYPSLKSRVFVAPDGAPDWPCNDLRQNQEKRARYIVGYVGSLYRGKGMEIVSQLAQLCPTMEFRVIGGEGPEITDWTKRLSAAKNIQFVGRYPHAKVYELMQECDVLLAPYLRTVEPHAGRINIAQWMSPLKIFEYMASGRPIIASDLPVLCEVLEHESNALLVNPDDVRAWGEALERLRGNPALAYALAHRARRQYEESYTWRARAGRIMRLVEEVG